MTTTDPTSPDVQPLMDNGLPMSLAEQIAREHTLHTVWPERCSCSCGATLDFPDGTPSTDFRYAHAAHIATVTERAVVDRLEALARELGELTITHQAENYATVLRIKREGVMEAIRRVRRDADA